MKYIKKFNPDTITNEQLIEELKKLSKKLKRTPSRNDMVKYGTSISKRLYLYGRRFGGLKEAQKLAGLKENKSGLELRYSSEDLLAELKVLHKKLGKTPTQGDINNLSKYTSGAYKRHFGTYNNALLKAGLKHNQKFNISEKEIKDDIIRIYKLLGKTPMVSEFVEYSETVSSVTACNKISKTGSWNDVLKICGIPILHNRNLSDQELKDEVIRLEKYLERLPGYYDMSNFGKYSAETYAYRKGTYVKTLKYLGFNYIPMSQWENQVFTLGKDNTLYRSIFEANIANILRELKNEKKIINYIYEYPVCPDRKWTCDFLVKTKKGSVWLEADGMGKNRPEKYSKKSGKIKYYEKNNINYRIVEYKKKMKKEYILSLVRSLR